MRPELKSIIEKLNVVKGKVEESLEKAEDAEYPNDERIEKLETELAAIEAALDELESIE